MIELGVFTVRQPWRRRRRGVTLDRRFVLTGLEPFVTEMFQISTARQRRAIFALSKLEHGRGGLAASRLGSRATSRVTSIARRRVHGRHREAIALMFRQYLLVRLLNPAKRVRVAARLVWVMPRASVLYADLTSAADAPTSRRRTRNALAIERARRFRSFARVDIARDASTAAEECRERVPRPRKAFFSGPNRTGGGDAARDATTSRR